MEPIKHYYELPDGSMISCTFYDSGGSVKYRSTIETFYKNVEGIVLIFDLTNKKSFDNLDKMTIWNSNVSEIDWNKQNDTDWEEL